MDINVAAQIFDDSTLSTQLVWDDEYRTFGMLQRVMCNRHKDTKPLHIEKISWFLSSYTETENGRSMARTRQVADFICRMLTHSLSRPRSVRFLGLTIANIAFNGSEERGRFSTRQVVSTIIGAINIVTTAGSVEDLRYAIGNIAINNPEGQLLFSTPESVSAIINALNKYATTADSVRCLGFAIGYITANNPEGQRLFSTPEAVSAIISALNKYATTPDSARYLGLAIVDITTNPEGKRLFSTPEAASAIISALNNYATTPKSVENFGFAIGSITINNPEGQRLFSTPEVVSAIINALTKYATTPGSVEDLGYAIGNIVAYNPEGKRLFSTPEAASAIISALNNYATTPDSVEYLGYAISGITSNNPEGQRLFATPEAVSAIISALTKYATTPISVENFGFAIGNITSNNPEGRRLLSTPEAVSAIINALNNFATTSESVETLCYSIVNITADNRQGQRLFSTHEVVSAIFNALNKHVTTPESVENVGYSNGNITSGYPEGRRLCCTNEAITAILRRLNQYSYEPDSISNLISAVANIAQNDKGDTKENIASEEFASIIRQMLENAHNSSTLCITLIATSFLHDSLLTAGRDSSMTSCVQDAANRLFGDVTLRMDEMIAICAALLVSLGDEYAEPVCRREILQGLERFAATEMTDNHRFKPQIQNAIYEITSRLVSRFHKWLNVLIRKHQDVGAEQIFSTEIVEILFKQELDEITFLRKSIQFFNELAKTPSRVTTVLIQLFIAETKSTEESSLLANPPATVSPNLQHLVDSLHREFPPEKIFLPSDISYSHGNQYGSGAYGSVILASIISQHHKHVAAKVFNNSQQGIEEAKNYLRLDHPHITKFVGVTIIPQTSTVVLLLELADYDFARILLSTASPLSLNKIKKFSLQIASALEYLHRKNLRHLDLKPQNVLVFRQVKEVKLADFGSILETEKTFTEKNFVAGTRSYLPPEHHAAREHRENIPVSATFDIFAFGVILMEMLIWDDENRRIKFRELERIKESVKSGQVRFLDSQDCCIDDEGWRQDVLNDGNGRKLIQICKKCLMIDPMKRIGDGGALVRALNDLAEDDEDIIKKRELREKLAPFQQMLLERAPPNNFATRGPLSSSKPNAPNSYAPDLSSNSN